MSRNKTNAELALEKVAKDNNVSVKTVYSEIEKAIDEARCNTNPSVKAMWEAMPFNGKKPSVEEFLDYLAAQVIEKEHTEKNNPISWQ